MHLLARTSAIMTGGLFVAALPLLAAPAQTIGLSGDRPALDSVRINTSHVYDYTFASPPTDWWVQSGVWDMTNRWSCSPGWSWFGGRSEQVASVWNKRKFSGDISAQAYFSFKMGVSGTPRWPEYPSNFAMTILGNGKDLGTGYTLIAGADRNTRTILMRNGKTVAQTTETNALFPTVQDGNPPKVHRQWWYMRINKMGARIDCYLDNELILSYTDPQPIESGQTAIWTYNNGIMLSRVQIYFAHEDAPTSHLTATPDADLLALAN